MSSLGVALPLELSSIDGFEMIKTIKKLTKQNLKMIILTNPGERVMVPDFGAGIQRYLFSNSDSMIRSEIQDVIQGQVGKYMPSVRIDGIFFDNLEENLENNVLSMSIEYSLPAINETDLLQITI